MDDWGRALPFGNSLTRNLARLSVRRTPCGNWSRKNVAKILASLKRSDFGIFRRRALRLGQERAPSFARSLRRLQLLREGTVLVP